MCGIVAFVDNEKPQVKESLIQKMMDRIIHRGPDDAGQFVDEHAALGHRRLSFVDVKSGKQPIFNENENLAILFNGEIYNFQPLREELIAAGHHFSTKTDTEVILHGYEQWGDDVCKKLGDVCLCHLEPANPRNVWGPRSLRHQAAVLRQDEWDVLCRFRNQGLLGTP